MVPFVAFSEGQKVPTHEEICQHMGRLGYFLPIINRKSVNKRGLAYTREDRLY